MQMPEQSDESPLHIWECEREWFDRNNYNYKQRRSELWRLLGLAEGDGYIDSILEVGCGLGQNLQSLRGIMPASARLLGVEPNDYARTQAVERTGIEIIKADCFCLPLNTGSFDLVFTSGVLMHVPDRELVSALKELSRVGRQLLLIEYDAAETTEIVHHGKQHFLWKRPYEFALDAAGLHLTHKGPMGTGFDRCTYWIAKHSNDVKG